MPNPDFLRARRPKPPTTRPTGFLLIMVALWFVAGATALGAWFFMH